MDLQVRINAFDIVDHRKDSSWSLVDIEVAERRVATDVVETVYCVNNNCLRWPV